MSAILRITPAVLLVILASAVVAPAQSPLTPQEVTDGWIMLFDGETTFGWKIDGEATASDGKLRLGGEKETKAELTTRLGIGEVRYVLNGATETRQTGQSHEIVKFHTKPGEKVVLSNVKFKPANMESIFNGRDFTGWREHANKKSKFSIGTEGELIIKDGPGDLQTEGAWADFVLQFDCFSHGKHLNSGLFFRCRPAEYQNGYEAQIRNEFTTEPTQTFVIEDYDPVTNKLLGKRKVQSTAVDYGTGAIYRRMPARKQMSKDGEWFTMTVVAHGKHFATWVNGIQVADWTDNRPLSDNARTGCRLEAGPISLQGHDPTTHLSFRNFRIADMRK